MIYIYVLFGLYFVVMSQNFWVLPPFRCQVETFFEVWMGQMGRNLSRGSMTSVISMANLVGFLWGKY